MEGRGHRASEAPAELASAPAGGPRVAALAHTASPARGGARPHIFRREVLRSIRGSLGRFLAVMGIVALGCGFYAGLQMSGPDMRTAGDRWYDGTRLWDLRVVSTLGLAEDDLARLAGIPGVEEACLAKTCDVMVSLGGEQIAARVTSIDVDAARASVQDGLYAVASDDPSYLNRPMLREGRWPEAAGECVISADAVEGFAVGDTVEVLYGTGDLEETLAVRSFAVVGSVSSSDYPYTGSFGSTTLGSGMIDEYLYVREDAFAEDFPYVEAYVRVAGAEQEASESAAYDAVVDEVQAHIEDREGELAQARREDLVVDAQATLDEKRAEYEAEKADAEAELADALAELEDAHAELVIGEASWRQGRSDYQAGASELASSRADAVAQLAAAQQELDDGRAELNAKRAQLEESATRVEQARQALADAEATLAGLREKQSELAATVEKLDAQIADAEARIAGLGQQIAALDAQIEDLARQGLPTEELEAQRQQLEGVRQAAMAGRGQLVDGRDDAASGLEKVEAGIAEATSPGAQAQLAQARQAVEAYDAGATALAEAQTKLDAGRTELASRRTQAERELAIAQAKLDAAASELASARVTLDAGWADYNSGKAEYDDARAEADKQFADAERDLAEAQRTIDEIELPDLYVLDRGQSEGRPPTTPTRAASTPSPTSSPSCSSWWRRSSPSPP